MSAIHHHHAIGQLGNHAQIVRNENHRHAQICLQFLEQPQDLRLHGDIERRSWFIGNKHLGIGDQRHGNHHPLAHAAGKLVRIRMYPLGSIENADLFQHSHPFFQGRFPIGQAVDQQRLN